MGEEKPSKPLLRGKHRIKSETAVKALPVKSTDSGGTSDVAVAQETPPAKLDARSKASIRRGKQSVEAVLDLHGHTRDSAHAMLTRFIEAAQARGDKLVLIITGKGKLGGGTLKTWLPRWLEETPLRGRIIAYDIAGPRHGGDGAWYVRIRKQAR